MTEELKVIFGNQEELFPLDFNAFTIGNIQCLGFELKVDNIQLGFEFDKQPVFLAINSKFNENLKPSRFAGFDYQLELVLNLDLKLDHNAATTETKVSFLYQFELKALNNYFKINNQDNTLGLISLANMAGLAYSTTRGLMLNHLERTIFKGYILPVINPVSLVLGS